MSDKFSPSRSFAWQESVVRSAAALGLVEFAIELLCTIIYALKWPSMC